MENPSKFSVKNRIMHGTTPKVIQENHPGLQSMGTGDFLLQSLASVSPSKRSTKLVGGFVWM